VRPSEERQQKHYTTFLHNPPLVTSLLASPRPLIAVHLKLNVPKSLTKRQEDLLRAFQDDVDGKEPTMFVDIGNPSGGAPPPLYNNGGIEGDTPEDSSDTKEKGWWGGIFGGKKGDEEQEKEEDGVDGLKKAKNTTS